MTDVEPLPHRGLAASVVRLEARIGIFVGCAGAPATAISATGSFNFQEKTHLKNRTANATTNSVAPTAAMIRKSSSIAGSFLRFCSTWRFYCR